MNFLIKINSTTMKYLLIFFATCVIVASSLNASEEWTKFKLKYNRLYRSSREEASRYAAFQQSLEKIEEHNKKYEAGLSTYKMGITKFADYSEEEFKQYLLKSGPRPELKSMGDVKIWESSVSVKDALVDWRRDGIVTPVKNQGSCGSCWSFAATGTLEGQYALVYNELKSFSEQCLVDCSSANYGCSGGSASTALLYVQTNGIPTEEEYPYEAVDGVCRYNGDGIKIDAVYQITSDTIEIEENLRRGVATQGPVAVSVDATYFKLYESGIFDDQLCSNVSHNHGVLVIGYGTEDNTDYWLVKNSWGEDYGEEGYIRMSRNKNNQCGIANWCYFPRFNA